MNIAGNMRFTRAKFCISRTEITTGLPWLSCETHHDKCQNTSPFHEAKPSGWDECFDIWSGENGKEQKLTRNLTAQGIRAGFNRKSEKWDNTYLGTGKFDINPELAIKARIEPEIFPYTDQDVILYALGVGVSTAQTDHLKFLYELSPDFSVLPTYAVVIGLEGTLDLFGGAIPGLRFDRTKMVHGEQYTEILRPLQSSGTLTTHTTVRDVLDKGSGAVFIADTETFNEQGEKIFFNQFVGFVNGAGGFGGKRSSTALIPIAKAPDRAPDASTQEKVFQDQAAVYRLSGDRSPLHIDPAFAAKGGHKRPILHGLCTYGIAARAVLKQYCNNDVSKFKAIKVRFANPIFTGQTLQTDMWKEGNRVHLETQIVETRQVVLSGAYVDLVEDKESAFKIQVSETGQVVRMAENTGHNEKQHLLTKSSKL